MDSQSTHDPHSLQKDMSELPPSWSALLHSANQSDSYQKLQEWLKTERTENTVFPPEKEVFTAFHLTLPSQVKVVILGQDPYHGIGQAHGLSFSVKPGIKIPPSLRNIYKELKTDLHIEPVKHGTLTHWAQEGVMMLNTVLTVQAHQANSHRKKGWEKWTDHVIQVLSEQCDHLVFILWGSPAHKKSKLIDENKHTLIKSPHPSPLSARRGFFGSAPFSKTNEALLAHNQSPINWQLPLFV